MKYLSKFLKPSPAQADPRFQEQLRIEAGAAFRGGAFMGSLLFLSGIFLDWMVARPYFISLTVVRVFSAIAFFCFFLSSKSEFVRKFPYFNCLLLVFTGSLTITLMCLLQTGYESPYYAGICLILTSLGVILPYDTRRTALLGAVCFFTYLIPVLIQARFRITNLPAFVNNLFFLSLTGIIAAVAAQLKTEMKFEIFTNLLRIEETNQRLQQYDQVKNQFFSNISHELRTPLSLILGAANRWKNTDKESIGTQENFEIIHSNSLNVLKHVNDLLDTAKLEAGKMVLKRNIVDLAELVRRVAAMFKVLADQKNIEFIVNTPKNLWANVDIEKVEKIISNLLSNACKFTTSYSQVICSLIDSKNSVQLVVKDTGPGIPQDQKEKVFERFYQSDSGDSRKYGGTGLGLSIVKEFTELHGGTIQFEDSIEGGLIAIVNIPNIESHDELEKRYDLSKQLYISSAPETIVADTNSYRSQTLTQLSEEYNAAPEIFIVEDNYDMRLFLEHSLRSHFSVKSFVNALDAIDAMKNLVPELILSDFMLPEMDGQEFFNHLKADPKISDIPVIFLTSKADDEMRLNMIEGGAFDYLVKPFSVQELLARLRNCLVLRRSKKILQKELNTTQSNLQILTGDILAQKHKLELAMKSAIIARDDALESNKVKSRFLSLISHELRTPLSTIKIASEFLSMGGANISISKQKELFDSLIRAADSLRELVERLLQYSKIQKEKFVAKKDLFQVSEMVNKVLNDYRSLAQHKFLKLSSNISENLNIKGDSEIIGLILSNLVSNAIKYTDSGSVSVDITEYLETINISVKDTGIGIEKNYLDKIFEEFERVPGPHSFVPGLGLGLSLVRSLVSILGGTITVKSSFGEGSCFNVEIPKNMDEFLLDSSLVNNSIEGRA